MASKTNSAQVTSVASKTPKTMQQEMDEMVQADLSNVVERMNSRITSLETNVATHQAMIDALTHGFQCLTDVVANMADKSEPAKAVAQAKADAKADIATTFEQKVVEAQTGAVVPAKVAAKIVGTPEAPLYVGTGVNAQKKAQKATAKPAKVTGKPASPKAEKAPKAEITKDEYGRPSNAKFFCDCSLTAFGFSQGFADKHTAKGHSVISR